jgi:hypothetical protein
MGDKRFLLTRIAIASLANAIACFGLTLTTVWLKIDTTPVGGTISPLISLLLPCSMTAWWMFRTLQTRYSKSEAKYVATAFAGFSPVWLLISFPLGGDLGGGFASLLWGPLVWVGVIAGISLLMTLLSFASCLFALWLIRTYGRMGEMDRVE